VSEVFLVGEGFFASSESDTTEGVVIPIWGGDAFCDN